MPNTTYPKGAEKFQTGAVSLSSDTIKACLVTDAYAFGATHEFVTDLGARVGTDQVLGSKTITDGVFDALDLDFGPIAPGFNIKAVVLYKDTGNTSTSPLLFYFDVVTGLPMASNGGIVTVPWGNDAKKIARLGLPFYPKGAEKTLDGQIDMISNTIKAILLPTSYVYDPAHDFRDDIAAIVGAAQTLAGKSVANGVFDATDVDFGPIAAGSTIGSIALFKDTAVPGTSPLLLRFNDVLGLPLTTNGGGVLLQWSNGAAKIVSLVPA